MIAVGIDTDMHKMAVAMVGFDHEATVRHVTPLGAWVVRHGVDGAIGRDAILAMNNAFVTFLGVTPLHVDALGGLWNPIFVIEHQSVVYTAKEGKNPQNIVNLSAVSGLVCGQLKMLYSNGAVLLPSPNDWKQSQPKRINQPRTYEKFGWQHEIRATGKNRYAAPVPLPKDLPGSDTWTMSDWKHIGDAFGLALHGVKACCQL